MIQGILTLGRYTRWSDSEPHLGWVGRDAMVVASLSFPERRSLLLCHGYPFGRVWDYWIEDSLE